MKTKLLLLVLFLSLISNAQSICGYTQQEINTYLCLLNYSNDYAAPPKTYNFLGGFKI